LSFMMFPLYHQIPVLSTLYLKEVELSSSE